VIRCFPKKATEPQNQFSPPCDSENLYAPPNVQICPDTDVVSTAGRLPQPTSTDSFL
jgi:hypothetical protein